MRTKALVGHEDMDSGRPVVVVSIALGRPPPPVEAPDLEGEGRGLDEGAE